MNIKEVAKRAGVSVATVSRVLNHPEVVCDATKQQVLSVMEEFNYTPNWFARGLNLARTDTLALLVSSIESSINQNIIAGVDAVARNKNSTVFLCNTGGEVQSERKYLAMMQERRVDGIILISSRLEEQELEALAQGKIPIIHVGKNPFLQDKNCCYINFEDAAYNLARHLKSLGHNQIDLFLDVQSNSKSKAIIAGTQRAAELYPQHQNGIIHMVEDNIKGGYIEAKKLFAQPHLPGALLASSDEIAFGIIKAAKDMGIAIPDTVAVAGFSNSPMCSLISPELTSVEQPAKRLGMVAARMLFDLVEQDEMAISVPQEVVLQPKLKIRKSCGNKNYIFENFE